MADDFIILKIKEINAKSIIVKSNLPESDFTINSYIGCSHACLYCYARFMKRFTNHPEPWGDFVDVKINAPDLIPENTDKYKMFKLWNIIDKRTVFDKVN